MEKYVLIYCSKCKSFFVCENGSKTTACRRCGKRTSLKNARIAGFSNNLVELQSRILILTARKECDDEFLASLEKSNKRV